MADIDDGFIWILTEAEPMEVGNLVSGSSDPPPSGLLKKVVQAFASCVAMLYNYMLLFPVSLKGVYILN